MAKFDRSRTTSYAVIASRSHILYCFRVIWRWRISLPWNMG